MIEQLLLHGATIYPISTNVSEEEHCSNLGIIVYKDKFIVNIRTVTYIPRLYSYLDHYSENYIGYFNELNFINTKRLPWEDGGSKVWNVYHGREDIRFVIWNDTLYGYATRTDVRDGKGCIEIMEFDDNLDIVHSVFADNIMDVEKNWMSVPDLPFTFVYWNDPLCLITVNPETGAVNEIKHGPSIGEVRGSTPLMKYKGKYITVVHQGSDEGYYESFVTYSSDFSSASIGEGFKLNPNGYTEFITGMIYNNGYVYLAVSLYDIVPLIIKIPEVLFDQWYSGTMDYIDNHISTPVDVIYKYLDNQNYKRALELLYINQDIRAYILFSWMLINNKIGFRITRGIVHCLISLTENTPKSADKYYLLSILYKLLDQPYQEYLYKAKQCGMPSSFFNRFFNEHFIK